MAATDFRIARMVRWHWCRSGLVTGFLAGLLLGAASARAQTPPVVKPLTSGFESHFSVALSIKGTSGTSTTERTLKRTAP